MDTALQSGPTDTEMLIGSRFVAGTEDAEVILDPRTGGTVMSLPEASSDQIDAAVSAAEAAFKSWSRTTPGARSACLSISPTGSKPRPRLSRPWRRSIAASRNTSSCATRYRRSSTASVSSRER